MKNKGFTLIELFIVIAIFCILMAIVIPRFVYVVHNLDSDNDNVIKLEEVQDYKQQPQNKTPKNIERDEGTNKL